MFEHHPPQGLGASIYARKGGVIAAWAPTSGFQHMMTIAALSRSYPLEQTRQAAYGVHGNPHEGKVGALCCAPSEGLGVEPEAGAFRARHLDAIKRFRAA